jgi:carbon-monoxide dehydrogenase large subunit
MPSLQTLFTNTMILDADRGAGRPEAIFVFERMMDLIADELGVDPLELRRRNYLPSGENIQTVTGLSYDSLDFNKVLSKFGKVSDYQTLREQQKKAREEGKFIGIGVVSSIDICGFAPSAVDGAVGLQA